MLLSQMSWVPWGLAGGDLGPTKVSQPPRDCFVVVRQSERKFISPPVHHWSPTVAHTPTLVAGGSRVRQQRGGCSAKSKRQFVCMHSIGPMVPHSMCSMQSWLAMLLLRIFLRRIPIRCDRLLFWCVVPRN